MLVKLTKGEKEKEENLLASFQSYPITATTEDVDGPPLSLRIETKIREKHLFEIICIKRYY